MPIIQEPGFERHDIQIDELLTFPEVQALLQRALAYALGWDDVNKTFRRVAVSDQGEVVSSPHGTRQSIVTQYQTFINTTGQKILDANPRRALFAIYNDNTEDLYVSFDGAPLTNPRYELEAGSMMLCDWYRGPVSMATISGSNTFKYMEAE